jgi:hypothetical protein
MVALIREYEVVYHFYLLSLGMVFVSQTTQNQIIMKKFIFLFFFFCFSTMMLAQNDVTIVGYIYDSETILASLKKQLEPLVMKEVIFS